MRLGLLGGTFDPVHLGHLDAARAACAALSLDRVLFVPSRVPPHRSRTPGASPFHRFAMVTLAIMDEPTFAASDLELSRTGPSFTIDTLQAFRASGLEATELFFITGVDAFAEIPTWHQYPAVLDAAHFVVVTRPGYTADALRTRLPELEPRFLDLGEFKRPAAGRAPRTAVVFVDAVTSDVSSTEIRRRIAQRASLTDMLTPAVERYIHQHRLYEIASPAFHLHGQI